MIRPNDGHPLPRTGTFLIYVDDDSLEPQYRRGAALYVDKRQQPRPGDAVVLVAGGGPIIAVLVERSPSAVRVRQRGLTATFAAAAVSAIYRAAPLVELLM
ncbi:MAG TPA: S24 family peptidase [Alphaproteobacteria bacterium]